MIGGRCILTKTRPVLWVTLHDTGWTINNFAKLRNISFWIKKAGLSSYCEVTHPQYSMHFAQLWMCMHLDACMFKCMCSEWVWVWLSGGWSDSVVSVEELTCWVVHDHYPPEDTFIDLLSQWLKAPHSTADETRLPLGHSPFHQPQLLPNICRKQKINVQNSFPYMCTSLCEIMMS